MVVFNHFVCTSSEDKYLKEAGTANWHTNDDFELKITIDLRGLYNLFQRCGGYPFRAWIYHCHLIHYKPRIAVAILDL